MKKAKLLWSFIKSNWRKNKTKKTYKITYKQRYMDKILTDSYLKTVDNFSEIIIAEEMLYEDECVFEVDWELVKEEK